MEIILSENVNGLGKMGDIVKVANGYARNFLIPQKLALKADKNNLNQITHFKAAINKKLQQERSEAEAVAKQLGDLSLQFTMRAGEEGKLFGSIGSKDILEAIVAKGFEVGKKSLVLERPIKDLGIFFVPVKVHSDVTGNVKVEVLPMEDASEAEPAKEQADEAVAE